MSSTYTREVELEVIERGNGKTVRQPAKRPTGFTLFALKTGAQHRILRGNVQNSKRASSHYLKLKLPHGSFGAYLFDCDGTIADSMPLHYLAWKKALEEWNCDFDEQLFYSWGGMPIVEIISTLNKKYGLSMPVEIVAGRKESLYYDLLPQLKAVPEVLEHIEAQHGRIPLAVVSGSTRESVTASLLSLNLLDKFDTMVCAGDYARSKPDPEAFLVAAANLRVAPQDCLVLKTRRWGFKRRRRQEWPRSKFHLRGRESAAQTASSSQLVRIVRKVALTKAHPTPKLTLCLFRERCG